MRWKFSPNLGLDAVGDKGAAFVGITNILVKQPISITHERGFGELGGNFAGRATGGDFEFFELERFWWVTHFDQRVHRRPQSTQMTTPSLMPTRGLPPLTLANATEDASQPQSHQQPSPKTPAIPS